MVGLRVRAMFLLLSEANLVLGIAATWNEKENTFFLNGVLTLENSVPQKDTETKVLVICKFI